MNVILACQVRNQAETMRSETGSQPINAFEANFEVGFEANFNKLIVDSHRRPLAFACGIPFGRVI